MNPRKQMKTLAAASLISAAMSLPAYAGWNLTVTPDLSADGNFVCYSVGGNDALDALASMRSR